MIIPSSTLYCYKHKFWLIVCFLLLSLFFNLLFGSQSFYFPLANYPNCPTLEKKLTLPFIFDCYQKISYEELTSDQPIEMVLPSKSVSYFHFNIPAGISGVFTLKNKSKTSDLYLSIYSDPNLNNRTDFNHCNSVVDKILIEKHSENTFEAYVKITNYGNSTATYWFCAHYVNIASIFSVVMNDALIKQMLMSLIPGNKQKKIESGQIFTIIMGLMRHKDFIGMSKDLIKSEIITSFKLSEPEDNLIISIILGTFDSYISEIYKYYYLP